MSDIRIDKNYKGLKDVGWRYELEGSLETIGSIVVDLDKGLFVSGSIEAGEYIEAGRYIEAGESIEAGGSYGVSAGLQITCKGTLTFGLKAFAGICTWRDISEEEKTITCGKLEGGIIEYGILKEIGMPEEVNENTKKKEAILKKIEELKAEADKL